MPDSPKTSMRAAAYAGLAVLIAVAYWQTPFHEFVDYDDPLYVTESPITQAGITWDGVRWALTDTSSGNWHPLTRLAHMLDCELFGLNPAGHHVMSVAWHVAATLLLLAVLTSMTGAFWPSAFVAALFGLHPLHVESVAWISERKDVMSAVCWFAAMGAYTRYARNPSMLRYLPVALLLAAGLLVKAMLVTLPCVLLLLDVWPLGRFGKTDHILKRVAVLALEKLPLFAIVAAHAVITMQTQRIAMTPSNIIPLYGRIANAVLSYAAYVEQTFWPSGLAVFYPYPALAGIVPRAVLVGALLLAITVCALLLLRRAPYLAVGWLWFLGTLVPVIGLVQVGLQSRADRYTYIPSVGLFICAAWMGAAVAKGYPSWRKPLAGAAVAIVLVCTGLSAMQSRHWRDSFSLFQHALAVTDDNFVAHTHVAHGYFERGDYVKAKEHYHEAVTIGDRLGWLNMTARAHFGLGQIAETEGDLVAAERHYIDARVADGDFSEAHNNLAGVHMAMGQRAMANGNAQQRDELYAAALTEAQLALDLDPGNHEAALNAAYLTQHFAERRNDMELFNTAGTLYHEALPHFDRLPEVHFNYSLVLERLGRLDDAVVHAERAIALKPDYEAARNALQRYRAKSAAPEPATISPDDP